MGRLVVESIGAVRLDGGDQLLHTERTVVDGMRVERTIEGIGPGCLGVEPVVRSSRVIAEYEREIAHKRAVSAYQNRHVTPIFKSRTDRLAAHKRRREAQNVPASAFEVDPSYD